MKKIILIFVTLLLLNTAIAEEIDISALTDDQLYILQTEVQNELVSRNLSGSIISNGVYIVGKDIKAGQWALYSIGASGSGIGCYLYSSQESKVMCDEKQASAKTFSEANAAHSEALYWKQFKTGNSWNLSLTDGMVLEIESFFDGICIIQETNNYFAP